MILILVKGPITLRKNIVNFIYDDQKNLWCESYSGYVEECEGCGVWGLQSVGVQFVGVAQCWVAECGGCSVGFAKRGVPRFRCK